MNIVHRRMKILLILEETHMINQISHRLLTLISMMRSHQSISKTQYMALNSQVVQISGLEEQIDQSIPSLQNTKEAKVHHLLPGIDSS